MVWCHWRRSCCRATHWRLYPNGGGPIVLSLLQSYRDHCVGHVWIRWECPKLKLVNHNAQALTSPTHLQVKAYVEWSRLSALATTWYPIENRSLVNAFFERWHQETSSFHFPVKEMNITLDNVSCLLHLLVTCRAIDHVLSLFDREAMKILLMTHLGIPTETKVAAATHAGFCVWAAMNYFLDLINGMIFANMSLTHVHVAYLKYLMVLDACHKYAWRVAALAYLYNHLSYASQYNNK
ncbi:Protein MAINTENANCE OF MERISTEMS [Glycine max]|nr:Protein MAINTENANCE OF MERISTEMS [Glycine max]